MSRNIHNFSAQLSRNNQNVSAGKTIHEADVMIEGTNIVSVDNITMNDDLDVGDDTIIRGDLQVLGTSAFTGAVTLPTNIYVDTINEKTTDNGVDIELVHLENQDLKNITGAIGSVGNQLKYNQSSGIISGFGITDNLDGTVDIAEGICYLRSSNSDTASINEYTITATTGISLTDNSENYIYVDYNSGSPNLAVTTTGSTVINNENDLIEIYEIYRISTTLHITTHFHYCGNAIQRVNKYLYDSFAMNRTSGLILSETGTRNVAYSSGVLWLKLNKISISSFDTSGSDTFRTYYYNGSAWIQTTAQTQWDNTQYNNIASGLVTMTNNRYGFHEFFIEADGDLATIYGQDEYVALSTAESTNVLTNLPDILGEHATYIGRFVFQKSGGTTSSILNPFSTNLNYTSSNDHGNLTGLTDDDHAQYTTLANRTGETLDIDDIEIQNLTATRLTASDASKKIVSTAVSSWVVGTATQVLSTDQGDGSVILSLPDTIQKSTNIQTLDVYSASQNTSLVLTNTHGSYDCNVSMDGILSIDTINEKTTDDGVTIEGLNITDSDITMATNTALTLKGNVTNLDAVFCLDCGAELSDGCLIKFKRNAVDKYFMGMNTSNNFRIYNYITTADSFSIGSTNIISLSTATYAHDMNGETLRDLQISDAGELGYNSGSLEIMKTNIEDDPDTSWIYELDIKRFNYKKRKILPNGNKSKNFTINDFSDNEYYPNKRWGCMVKQLENIKPEFVFYDVIKEKKELRGVHYKEMVPVLIKVIQQHKKNIDRLNKRLKENQKENFIKLKENVFESIEKLNEKVLKSIKKN